MAVGKSVIWGALAAIVIGVSGCSSMSGGKVETAEDDGRLTDSGARGYETGRISDLFDLGTGTSLYSDNALPVNRYLWRASLDTLAFLPLSSTDPFTGVIATDWAAAPEAPEERFKVSAYVTSPQLTATALKVAVFREVRDENGAWVTAPVSGRTARRLEDAILLRARQLKLAEKETG